MIEEFIISPVAISLSRRLSAGADLGLVGGGAAAGIGPLVRLVFVPPL